MICVLISLIVIVAYLVYAIGVIKAIPCTVSDTYYQLRERNHSVWLFQIAMIVPAMVLMPVWLEYSTDNIQFLSFLACAGLMFVGTAPLFKEEFERKVHYAGAAIAGIATILWVCLSGMGWLPMIVFTFAGMAMLRYKKWLFWAEIATFICAYVGILLKILSA